MSPPGGNGSTTRAVTLRSALFLMTASGAIVAAAPVVRAQVGQAASGRPALIASTDTAPVTVGDPVVVRVLVRVPRGAVLRDARPRLRGAVPDGVRLLDGDSLRTTAAGDAAGALRVVFFRPGIDSLPGLVVAYSSGARGPVDSVTGSPIPVRVRALVPPTTGTLRDIKDLERGPLSLDRAAAAGAALAIAALAIAAALARRRWARRRAADNESPNAWPSPSPYERALASLAAIADARFAARGELTRHYALVADVIRQYLEDGCGIRARERTTAELLLALPPSRPGPEARQALRRLLDRADLVKFARLTPTAASASAFLDDARALLMRFESADGIALSGDGVGAPVPGDQAPPRRGPEHRRALG